MAADQNPANNATKVDKELSRLGWSHSSAEGFANDQNNPYAQLCKNSIE